MLSIERALHRRQGALPGLPLLVGGALLTLVFAQSIDVSEAFQLLSATPLYGLPTMAVGTLAAALGFQAAQRRPTVSARTFAVEQIRLVLPPLAFVVLASVAVLGPLLTNLTLRDYATQGDAYAYLLNLVGLPRYRLPGVFEFNNAAGIVNANLWVTPFYVMLALAAAIPSRSRLQRAVPLGLAAILAVALLVTDGLDTAFDDARNPLAVMLRGDGSILLLCGLSGMGAASWSRRVPVSGRLALAALGALLVAEKVGSAAALQSGLFRLFLALPVTYLTIYLALQRFPLASIARRLTPYFLVFFLVSYPLQQLVFDRGPRDQGLVVNFAVAALASSVLAAGFWHLIGRRTMPGRFFAQVTPSSVASAPPRAVPFRRMLRQRLAAIAQILLIGGGVAALFLLLLAMLYFAMQPDSGGM